MGFVSYSEDILKRHEADVHDLLREIEAGQLGVAQQHHVVPQFEQLLQQLKAVLSDPKNPIAIRLLEMRTRVATLEADVRAITEKRDALSCKNAELNERERAAKVEANRVKRELETLREQHASLNAEKAKLVSQVSSLKSKINELEKSVARLTKDLFESQVDVRYKK